MGDAAASLIGRRYGRRKWLWSGGKSLEGSFAFVVAVAVGLCLSKAWLILGGWSNGVDSLHSIGLTVGKCLIAATGASLTEAVLTGGNDNVVVPIVLWLLVRGLKL
jgi:dolichol kinase